MERSRSGSAGFESEWQTVGVHLRALGVGARAASAAYSCGNGERLPVMLAAVKANLGEDARQVLADAGFRSEAVFEQLKDGASELIVALGREGKQAVAIDAGQYPHTAAMEAKFKTPQAQAAYRKRKWIVEAPNGWIKSVLGFRQFSLRGLNKVTAEFKLVCMALNLRRMCALRAA